MGLNAVQSYPAERVLVAALLGRPASFHELGGRVTEEMFTEPGLRLVFRAFAELASRGERIDMATVEAEMFRLDHPALWRAERSLFPKRHVARRCATTATSTNMCVWYSANGCCAAVWRA